MVNVKDFHPPEMTPTFLPGTGLFLAVVTCITIAGKSGSWASSIDDDNTWHLDPHGPVHLFGTTAFLTSQPDAAQESLFVLNIHINLDTQFSIQEEKLWCSLALDRELLVKGFLVNIIEAAYVPAINGALHEGIPLPNLLGIKYEHADIRMSE
ncbi:unnamed protein product, partial [Eretmochelys imbricata]